MYHPMKSSFLVLLSLLLSSSIILTTNHLQKSFFLLLFLLLLMMTVATLSGFSQWWLAPSLSPSSVFCLPSPILPLLSLPPMLWLWFPPVPLLLSFPLPTWMWLLLPFLLSALLLLFWSLW
ncbi:uncharacterized protein BX664DRAFT_335855 [Halteromyces radiatus]|uniref:uncharacterized protein n=1 Tax=Halteromyces radiatus TaxID=101107 RepID=UPI00221ECE74|nr:uncharacterized protein BX664DRAFT_335855 [Halteromyces radiatus]KAI8086460.1 hypothetical protein BX664DRAFT_335855 [Halteromyces radiatus]